MALTFNQTRRVEIPHEPGEWFELRALSFVQFAIAEEARQRKAAEQMRAIGADVLSALPTNDKAPDPLQQYDIAALLKLGVLAWSYTEPVSDEAIESLDPRTAQWAARELLSPLLRTEEDRMANFFSSTEPSTA